MVEVVSDGERRLPPSLRDAVEGFRLEPGSNANAYDWYRRQAQRSGRVSFGYAMQISPHRIDVRAAKIRGAWMVRSADFKDAMAEHRAAMAERRAFTQDYRDHVLHGRPGDTLFTELGGYHLYADFHRGFSAFAKPWKDSGEWWTCNHCSGFFNDLKGSLPTLAN